VRKKKLKIETQILFELWMEARAQLDLCQAFIDMIGNKKMALKLRKFQIEQMQYYIENVKLDEVE